MERNMKKINIKWKVLIIMLFVLAILASAYGVYVNIKKSDNILEGISKVDDIDVSVKLDNGDEEISWDEYEEKQIILLESLTINKEGVYYLTGTISDGYIKVNVDGNIKLVLDNVSITNSNGPAIIIENAKNTVIQLKENSKNYLEDSKTYTNYEENVDGVIYSKDDIIFEGTGELTIKANHGDGIVGKDDLKIISGTYNITSADDGIRGKDSVYILDGNFYINAKGDGIKSTNEEKDEKGFVLIENGNFEIEASQDGIQAETNIIIKDGKFNIKTGGGSENSNKGKKQDNRGRFNENKTTSSENTTTSTKGIKAGNNIVISGGYFDINSSDDSIHSNNYIGIKNGTFEISAGDDGIHADNAIVIENSNTNINISKSYEGIEASRIVINDGTIKLVASDDGINAAGKEDSQNMMNKSKEKSNNILIINGGDIFVNASGDGIDLNGSGYIYGGNIIVDGPSSNGDGALDYDGELVVSGGNLLAVGSSGMAQGVSSKSTVYNVMINLSTSYSSGKKIVIEDSEGNEIVSYSPTKTYSSIVVTSNKLEKSKTYKVLIDDEEVESFTITSVTTNVGNKNNNREMRGGGGRP